MLNFANDYSEGAHDLILQKLLACNREQLPGYGADHYCTSAKRKIRAACGQSDSEIYFLVGGTQTNQIVIGSMLRPYEGVIAATSGHISLHEAGAIESTGHKVLEIPHTDGKISAKAADSYLQAFYEDENHSHMVYPGMIYLSHPTEYGTLYTKKELADLSQVCRNYQIPLYLDGARLSYGLASARTDVTLRDIAEYCDVFYIGGTKTGALFGEAVVFSKQNAPAHFMTRIKQHGALLAKGWLLGIQFDVLFTDQLYLDIAGHAIAMADKLRQACTEKNYSFFVDSPTNQLFLILEDNHLKELQKNAAFSFWEKADANHTVVRIATSWATREQEIASLIALL